MEKVINKFSQFKMKTLLTAVQDAGAKFSDPKFREKMTGEKRRRYIAEVGEMQRALMEKLDHMDRLSPDFFPPSAYIEYEQYESPEDAMDFNKVKEPSRFGRVVGHENGKVLVQLEGIKYFVRAEPVNLRLRFIRSII